MKRVLKRKYNYKFQRSRQTLIRLYVYTHWQVVQIGLNLQKTESRIIRRIKFNRERKRMCSFQIVEIITYLTDILNRQNQCQPIPDDKNKQLDSPL